jgi:HEAT repeat protein
MSQDLPAAARAEREDSESEWETEPPIPFAEVQELVLSLDKAARARRLYAENNPVYQGFIAALISAFGRLWDRVPSLTVTVEEQSFRCFGRSFAAGEGRDSLPFAFYKDGIRILTFLPGFEEEAERFLQVVNRGRQMDQRAVDDLVTLLWEEEFTAFQYSYVDALSEGFDIPDSPSLHSTDQMDLEAIAADAAAEPGQDSPEEVPPLMREGRPSVASAVSRDDFVETLYFLEPEELDYLRQEVELEWQRDTKTGVLDALFDRLEDPIPERQLEILRVVRQLLPAYLGRGDLLSAARILEEMNQAVAGAFFVGEEQRREANEMLIALSDPEVLGQLLSALEDGSIDPAAEELGVFLGNLGHDAMPMLIRAAETTETPALRRRLLTAVEGLGREHPKVLIGLIGADDMATALGAARLAGQLQLNDAAPHVAALYRRADAPGRRLAIEALVQIRSSISMAAALEALVDEDREVRIAAARGLAASRYQPARQRLEEMIQSKALREADLTEQIAIFEAFGAVASGESVKMLDRLLNGRRLLGKQTPEIRACAAMALGRVGSNEARTSLLEAAQDPHPMVRSAVTKALGQDAR